MTSIAMLGLASSAFAEKGKKGKKMSPEKKAEILEKFDADGDGELSEEEKETAKAAHKAKMLEEFDADGDGELSEEEKEAARAAHGKKGGKKGKKGEDDNSL